jgi:hypothetical protein
MAGKIMIGASLPSDAGGASDSDGASDVWFLDCRLRIGRSSGTALWALGWRIWNPFGLLLPTGRWPIESAPMNQSCFVFQSAARLRLYRALTLIFACLQPLAQAAWQPAKGPLITRWAKDVSPEKTHPEYPRPQMERAAWLNLNGLWDYAVADREAAQPTQWDGQILVPFPVQSALSGVMKTVSENQRLWYHRSFVVPAAWQGKRVILNFGAVDWEAKVLVNGQKLGAHRGGYDGFRFDITGALKSSGEQEIVVTVWDPTDAGTQPRGKQVRKPNGIWYTPTTGIWQTVWLEPVSATHLEALKIIPDVDGKSVQIGAAIASEGGAVTVKCTILDKGRVVGEASITDGNTAPSGTVQPRLTLPVPDPKLWSPSAPFLYDLKLVVLRNGREVDRVSSYFGMRKIALGKDKKGFTRLLLNNQPLFQLGPLDQGFWPDGLYTAPTDEALRYDIEMTKKLNFNLIRKHVKIESDRWYYWCDRLGLLVWQDMPSGDKYISGRDPDIQRTEQSGKQFETELKALVEGRGNHPCIVMWVPYNEGWGQWDTARIVELIKSWDSSRLVNNTSGWTDRGVGDVNDIHRYPGPAAPKPEEKRAGVLGEFGGLGLPVSGHTWQNEKNWGYRSFTNSAALTGAYVDLMLKLYPLIGAEGLSAAVYTQTTDVEVEVNGLMTYDRAMTKMDADIIAAANKRAYEVGIPQQAFRPPSVPLVACDPYFSIWSPADRLTDVPTSHWTTRPHRLTSLVRIDDKAYRIMGNEPADVPPLTQSSLKVLPTRTIYTFDGAGVRLTLTFMTPALPDDLDVLSRPVTYLTWDVKATDGTRHAVKIYYDNTAEPVVNEPTQAVVWETGTSIGGTVTAEAKGRKPQPSQVESIAFVKFGSKDQPVLAKKGDDLRIDWGYLYTAAPAEQLASHVVAPVRCRRQFAEQGSLPSTEELSQPRAVNNDGPVAAFSFDLGEVGARSVSRWLMLAYDDRYSIQYFQRNLRPYWCRDMPDAQESGIEAAGLLLVSATEYKELQKRCAAFDEELMADLRRIGGEKYAQMCALAYRQCFAGNKIAADENGQPLLFPKENTSNGCIGTVDVIYPMAPQFLFFGPSLTKAMLVSNLDYAGSPRWKFPFAPHDLGTYPQANGQVYGGGERTEDNQMPVEETGNMIILVAALAQMEGNADFAGKYWPVLQKWADYLKAKGFDPENQLCTDDFAGHLAHNVNLSGKAIVALGAFGKLCQMRGETAPAKEYTELAKEYAARWVKEADDGDHFRLAFDKPGSWSQKYNLVWDRILGLNLFPAQVLRKEMDYYRKNLNAYGLPLDNRKPYAKIDWTVWTATLTGSRADFAALIDPAYQYLNDTPDRVPVNDLYWTKTGREAGMHARPVVGAFLIKGLYDPALWKKWARRDRTKAANWAPLPTPPKISVVVPTSEETPQRWHYTTQKPTNGWFGAGFDDQSWSEGPGGFGTEGTPGAVVRTEWKTSDIWLRREFTMPQGKSNNLCLRVHHDEDAEVYINGVQVLNAAGYTTEYDLLPLPPTGKAALKPGKNLFAVHCKQTVGGQYVDVGLVDVVVGK